MRHLLSLLLVAPLTLTGCAALLIQPDDSTATTAAKVAGRVPLALATVGFSEIVYSCARGGWAAEPLPAYELGTPEALAVCMSENNNRENEPTTGWGPHNSTFDDYMKDQRHHRDQKQHQKGHDIRHKGEKHHKKKDLDHHHE